MGKKNTPHFESLYRLKAKLPGVKKHWVDDLKIFVSLYKYKFKRLKKDAIVRQADEGSKDTELDDNQLIINAVVPRGDDPDWETKLEETYLNILHIANMKNVQKLVIPPFIPQSFATNQEGKAIITPIRIGRIFVKTLNKFIRGVDETSINQIHISGYAGTDKGNTHYLAHLHALGVLKLDYHQKAIMQNYIDFLELIKRREIEQAEAREIEQAEAREIAEAEAKEQAEAREQARKIERAGRFTVFTEQRKRLMAFIEKWKIPLLSVGTFAIIMLLHQYLKKYYFSR